MDFNRFTTRAQQAVQEAQGSALERGNPRVELEHLFRALVHDREGLLSRILERQGCEVSAVETAFDEAIATLPFEDPR